MSKENAKAFVQAILNDEELREKTANIKPEEIVPFAKEMGYDFTLEELKEVKEEDIELSPEELENVAGGDKYVKDNGTYFINARKKIHEQNLHCYNDLRKPLHNWVKLGQHKEEPILEGCLSWLGNWSDGYDLCKCTLCGEESWIHD